jgi:hypothetical protein
MNTENAKTEIKNEQIELLQMKIQYHSKRITDLQKLLKKEFQN